MGLSRSWTPVAVGLALALTTIGCDWLAGGRASLQRLTTRDMTPEGIQGSSVAGARGHGPDVALGGRQGAGAPGEAAPPPGAIAGPGQRPGNPAAWGESSRLGVARQFDPIRFGDDSTELDLAAQRRLQEVAEWLKANPRVWALLAGHCSRSATTHYAYGVGMERAVAGREFLVMQGVPAWRLYCISYGADRPEAPGASPDANALNDRVEILGFLQPAGVVVPKPLAEADKNVPASRAPSSRHASRELAR
jgi:peptidoglycan-associated lipoprotein